MSTRKSPSRRKRKKETRLRTAAPLAIIRYTYGTPYEPGDLAQINTHDTFTAETDIELPCTLLDSKHNTWIHRSRLLLLEDFLKRQPFDNFWVATTKVSWLTGEVTYLTDPMQRTLGNKNPFRFDSLGELVYYMRKYPFVEPFRYVHVTDMKSST